MKVWSKIKAFLKVDDALALGRNHHIDALKGVAILLVVLGHSVQVHDANFDNNPLFRVIYSFHMPMFMFLSGFIVPTQLGYSYLDFIKKNALRLLLPFFVWYMVSYVVIRANQDVSLVTYYLNLLKSPGIGLWFLWVLFLNSALLVGALKLSRCRNWQHRENFFVLGAILLSLAASPDILGLSEVKKYFPYYAAGFFISKYSHIFRKRKNWIYAVAVIAFPLLVLGWKRNELPLFYPALVQLLDNQPLARLLASIYKYAVAFTGIAFCSFILDRIRRSGLFNFFCWLGLFTLDIYVCHSYFMIGVGAGACRYLVAFAAALLIPLALTLLLMRRFKITRLLLLGQSR